MKEIELLPRRRGVTLSREGDTFCLCLEATPSPDACLPGLSKLDVYDLAHGLHEAVAALAVTGTKGSRHEISQQENETLGDLVG